MQQRQPRLETHARTVHLPPGSLPPPATKFTLTQCLLAWETGGSLQFVWLIVGTFYNSAGRPVWSREIRLTKLDPSDTASSSSSSSSASSEGPEITNLRPQDEFAHSLPHRPVHHTAVPPQQHVYLAAHHPYPPRPPPYYPYSPYHHPQYLQQQAYIPAPRVPRAPDGHWQTHFDPSQRRWVNTWHPQPF